MCRRESLSAGVSMTMGRKPHIHFVMTSKQNIGGEYLRTLIRRSFPMSDIRLENVDNFGAKYLSEKFIKLMQKKGRTQQEKDTTNVWRRNLGIKSFYALS